MTCKDCIHNDVCRGVYLAIQDNTKLTLKEFQILCEKEDFDNQDIALYDCLFFQDRSQFIELPCKVGDILYHPVPLRNMIAEYKIKSFQIYPHCVWVNWNIVDGVATINMSGIYAKEIGKTVFLTREEAEQALKEREENE